MASDWVDVHLVRVNPQARHVDGPEQTWNQSGHDITPVLAEVKKMHAKGRGVIGMKLIGDGEFQDAEDREKAARFVMARPEIAPWSSVSRARRKLTRPSPGSIGLWRRRLELARLIRLVRVGEIRISKSKTTKAKTMQSQSMLLRVILASTAFLAGIPPAAAASVKLALALGRTAYQTNETIDVSVTRSDVQSLPAADPVRRCPPRTAAACRSAFRLRPSAAGAKGASATEHLHLNGWLLRPGHYTLAAVVHGATASAEIDVYSHVRRSTFKTLDWGCRVQGPEMALLGEDGIGFNLLYGDYRQQANTANAQATLRGGADYMQCCTMSGGHQMDLRSECDWSDPLVVKGGSARAAKQAFFDRTKANALGVHFYDEPGLTWENGTPHTVSAQLRAFKSAFGNDRIAYTAVKPGDADATARWQQWGRWKTSFLEAAWKDARFAVEQVRPDLISATQSQYAWNAYADGYYFNAARSLPVLSGHGGYDDGPGSYFYPAYHLEFGRMRQCGKPDWYLPNWGNTAHDELYRLEQYLCFMNDLQGLAKSPDPVMNNPYAAASSPSVVETNKLGLRLGTIFNTMPPTRGEVAVLYPLSQCLDAQINSSMKDNYLGDGLTRGRLLSVYFAGKIIRVPFTPVVEEDVLDGSLAADFKALVLTNVNYLDPKVVAVLEDYAAKGGLVLMTDDCKTRIKGAKRLSPRRRT